MSDTEFQTRGLPVFVDTTEQAELDIAAIRIAESDAEKIAKNLKSLPLSRFDICENETRRRQFFGRWDATFFLSMEPDKLRVTILALENTRGLESSNEVLWRVFLDLLPRFARTIALGGLKKKKKKKKKKKRKTRKKQ